MGETRDEGLGPQDLARALQMLARQYAKEPHNKDF